MYSCFPLGLHRPRCALPLALAAGLRAGAWRKAAPTASIRTIAQRAARGPPQAVTTAAAAAIAATDATTPRRTGDAPPKTCREVTAEGTEDTATSAVAVDWPERLYRNIHCVVV